MSNLKNKNFSKKDFNDTKNVIDLLYNVFSFKLINSYFMKYLLVTTYDTIQKKLSSKNVMKLQSTVLLNKFSFLIENIYWSIKQSNHKENRKNLLFQKKVYSLEELEDLVEKIIISIYKTLDIKINDIIINKIKKKVFNKMSLKKMIPFLEKNHLPPLASENIFKTYEVKDKRKNIENLENVTEYFLYRKNDIINKFPLTTLSTGFKMKQLIEDNYVNVNLRYLLNDKLSKILKERFTGKKKEFNNAVYYLLTYYDLNEFLRANGDFFDIVPKIKNKKLNQLYNKAIELVGTPFTVPDNKPYYGLFPDVEQYFGSIGSFYDVNPTKGIYSINLPPSYIFMKDAIVKIEKWLDSAVKNDIATKTLTKIPLTFILWVPLNIYFGDNFEVDLSTTLFENIYEELSSKLEKSKYLKFSVLTSKNNIFVLSSKTL